MTSQDAFSYAIGPGVQAMMVEFDDEPRSDEITIVETEGKNVTRTVGRDAVYVYVQEDNRTNRIPFVTS